MNRLDETFISKEIGFEKEKLIQIYTFEKKLLLDVIALEFSAMAKKNVNQKL